MSGKIRGQQIKDESITDSDLSPNSVKASEISPEAISGQTLATSANNDNDRLLLWDADDGDGGTLKQIAPGNLGLNANLTLSGAQSSDKTTQTEVNPTGRIIFDGTTGIYVDPDGANNVKIRIGSHFNPIAVADESDVVADGESKLTFIKGLNTSITTDNDAKSITFNALQVIGLYLEMETL